MAKDVERLVVELSADVSRLERGLKAGQAATLRATRGIERNFEQMNQRTTRSVSMMTTAIGSSIAGLALGAAVREVGQYADAWTRASNSLRAGGLTQAETARQMEQLVAISLRSRSSLASTVTLYQRLTAASGELGVSQQQVARVTETVNKALATSNMSQSERASAVTQLAQGLGSGNLAGDELKAIRENSVVLAQAIADEFGVAVGELKKLGEEGELTSVRVFAAIEKASGSVDSAFGRTRATIDDALTNLQTRVIEFVGNLDASTGASAKFAATVQFVAENLDEIATAATYAGIAVGGGLGAAMTVAAVRTTAATVSAIAYQVALIRLAARTSGATTAQVAFNAALTANPIGLVIVAAAALAAGVYFLSQRYGEANVAQRKFNDAAGAAEGAMDAYREAAYAAANATDANAAAARRAEAATRNEAVARIANARAAYTEAAALAARNASAASEAAGRMQRSVGGGKGSMESAGGQYAAAQASANAAARVAQNAQDKMFALNYEFAKLQNDIRSGALRVAPAAVGGGGGGGGRATGGGGRSAADRVSEEAREVERLRDEVERLSYDILTETEQAAVDLAKVRDTLTQAAAKGIIQASDIEPMVGGYAARDLKIEDAPRLTALENSGKALADELRGGLEAERELFAEQGRDMARNFVDIIAADDIGSALGQKFREAAFNGIEDVLTGLFSQLLNPQTAPQGGIGGAIAGGFQALFGGKRALGGPVKAGRFYKVNENTPNSEFFAPKSDGYVGNLKPQRAQASRGPVSMTFRTEYNLQGAAGTEAILGTVQRMQSASERRILATVKAAGPSAQLEHTLLQG